MANRVVIGVDGGTTAVKAVAFDLEGRVVTLAHRNVPVEYGRNGEAEQDANQIWEGVADCLAEVTKALGADNEIIAVGLTGQGDGCWLVDADGVPVRPMPNWMDGRAAKRVAQWEEDGRAAAVLEVTGTTLFPGLAPVLLEEIAEKEPENFAKADRILYCKDWLRFKLTGNKTTDYTEASRHFLDVRTAEGYSKELAERLGMPENLKLAPEILSADALGGKVNAEAAARPPRHRRHLLPAERGQQAAVRPRPRSLCELAQGHPTRLARDARPAHRHRQHRELRRTNHGATHQGTDRGAARRAR